MTISEVVNVREAPTRRGRGQPRIVLSEAQIHRARYIRTLLAWHDITQSDLARVLGISQPAANRKLKGQRRWEIDELVAIAEAFDLDPTNMLRPPSLETVFGTVRNQAPDLLTWPNRQPPLVRAYFGAVTAGGTTESPLSVSARAA